MSTYGFDLIATREIQVYKSKVDLFRHKKTGAELLSIQNDDENKFFGITFRTPPPDATGVAHILEHAVLAGSEKYPLKEPFVELLKGSLASFVNAMTFEDKTTYPVASQNL
ncbi:MAG: insulinase family protein, partial [Anaerolineales bacterium]